MVKDHQINLDRVEKYLESSNLIISHNAQFDRTFFESLCPALSKKPWVCLMKNIDWKAEGIESHKLEYLAYRFGFFYEGHRAIIDCLAGIHILSKRLPKSTRHVLTRLLENCRKITYKLWAKDAPYECKDLLKKRGYRWERNIKENYKAWTIELSKGNLENEITYLRQTIYSRKILLPIYILDAYTRFSIVNTHLCSKHHKGEIEWLATL
jgi:DNA polymerase-3 subunit epsilon